MIDCAYLKKYGSRSGLQTTRKMTTVKVGRPTKAQTVRRDPLSLVNSFLIFQYSRLNERKTFKYAEELSAQVLATLLDDEG